MKDRDRRHERVKWGKQIKCSKRITSQTIKKSKYDCISLFSHINIFSILDIENILSKVLKLTHFRSRFPFYPP